MRGPDTLYTPVLPEFRRHHAAVVGISVDDARCHAAFAQHRNLHLPLHADFEPKGAVAQSYGAYRSQEGGRAGAVRDEGDGSYLSPLGVNPGADGIVEALEAMTPAQRRSV